MRGSSKSSHPLSRYDATVINRTSLIKKKQEQWLKDAGNTRNLNYSTEAATSYDEGTELRAC